MRQSVERVEAVATDQVTQRPWAVPAVVAGLALTAAGIAGLLLMQTTQLGRSAVALAVIFIVLMALAWRFPLPLVEKTKLHLDTAVTVACVLYFAPDAPGIAVAVIGGGTLLGELLRRSPLDQGVFNSSQTMLQAAAGLGTLAMLRWDGVGNAGAWMTVLAACAVGIAATIVNMLAVSTIVSVQTTEGFSGVARRTILGMGFVGHLAEGVQIAIGIVATEIAFAAPWAVILLILPVIGIYGVLRHNIELRDQLEIAIREREQGLAEVERLAGFGSWEWHLRCPEHHWSDELYRIVGLQPQNIDPTHPAFIQFAHPADRAMLEDLVREAIRAGTPFDVEHRILRTDGSERIVHTHADVIHESPGEPLRLIGTVHDLTERKALESQLLQRVERVPLTSRELHVLNHLARGNSNKEIASELGISEQTVKNHVASIMRKLRVNDRTQAVVAALRLGFIHLDDPPADFGAPPA